MNVKKCDEESMMTYFAMVSDHLFSLWNSELNTCPMCCIDEFRLPYTITICPLFICIMLLIVEPFQKYYICI